jgi:hypothetical protein
VLLFYPLEHLNVSLELQSTSRSDAEHWVADVDFGLCASDEMDELSFILRVNANRGNFLYNSQSFVQGFVLIHKVSFVPDQNANANRAKKETAGDVATRASDTAAPRLVRDAGEAVGHISFETVVFN